VQAVEPIWDIGLAIVIGLQGLGDSLILPMQAITWLGTPGFYVLLIPVCCWCADARLGLRLAIWLMGSIWVNEVAKVALQHPRLFWLTPQVRALDAEGSYGLPSGHAQHSVILWGILAFESRRRWVWLPAGALIALIGVSRVYLGVHFPSDVLAGWLVGLLILWGYLRYEARVGAFFTGLSLARQIGWVVFASLVMLGLTVTCALAHAGVATAPAWVANAEAAVGPAFSPNRLDTAVVSAGFIFGIATGACLLARAGGLQLEGSLPQRFARLPVGMLAACAIWWASGQLAPGLAQPWDYAVLYGRVALIGFWVSFGAPLIFRSLRLVRAA
jgi:membrane-associated phospholipid phosphatase